MMRRTIFLSTFAACVIVIVTVLVSPVEMLEQRSANGLHISSHGAHSRLQAKSFPERLDPLPFKHKVQRKKDSSVESHSNPDGLKVAQEALLGVMRCKWAADTERGIRKELDKPIIADSASSISAEAEKVKLLQDNLTRLTSIRESCTDKTAEELDRDVYDKLLAAAKLGDMNAATCYIVAPYEAPSLQADAAAFEEYSNNAADLIQKGIFAGDWNIVYLLETGSSASRGQSGWFDSLLIHDDLTNYQYKKLRRLGSIGEEAHELDSELAEQARKLIESGGATASAIRGADQWAQEMYQTYFVDSVRLSGVPALCQDPTGRLQGIIM